MFFNVDRFHNHARISSSKTAAHYYRIMILHAGPLLLITDLIYYIDKILVLFKTPKNREGDRLHLFPELTSSLNIYI